MGKANTAVRKQNRVDLQNLSEKDLDILNLPGQEVMEKYGLENKQWMIDGLH